MSAPARITAAPFVLDADELAELLAEDERAERIEMARDAADERARWHRRYADGTWNLDECLDYTGQSLADFMPTDARVSPVLAGEL